MLYLRCPPLPNAPPSFAHVVDASGVDLGVALTKSTGTVLHFLPTADESTLGPVYIELDGGGTLELDVPQCEVFAAHGLVELSITVDEGPYRDIVVEVCGRVAMPFEPGEYYTSVPENQLPCGVQARQMRWKRGVARSGPTWTVFPTGLPHQSVTLSRPGRDTSWEPLTPWLEHLRQSMLDDGVLPLDTATPPEGE